MTTTVKIPTGYADALVPSLYGQERVRVYRHEDDERHIVVDHALGRIVRRFRDGESAWSNAERWARDYARTCELAEDEILEPDPVRDMDDAEDDDWARFARPIRAEAVRR